MGSLWEEVLCWSSCTQRCASRACLISHHPWSLQRKAMRGGRPSPLGAQGHREAVELRRCTQTVCRGLYLPRRSSANSVVLGREAAGEKGRTANLEVTPEASQDGGHCWPRLARPPAAAELSYIFNIKLFYLLTLQALPPFPVTCPWILHPTPFTFIPVRVFHHYPMHLHLTPTIMPLPWDIKFPQN